MTLLLIIPAWMLLMALVAGLCMSARTGDVELRREQVIAESLWEAAGADPVVAVISQPRARSRAPRDGERPGVGVAA
jgi:hypothetical protein